MRVVRWCTALAVTLVSSGIADAQLPGLPYTPWQSGIGYFVGPYGSGASSNSSGSGVYCLDLRHVLQYGFTWTAFLTPIAHNNATPTGYSYAGLGNQCSSLGQGFSTSGLPNGFNPNSQNLLYNPPAQPTSLGPHPNLAAFRILPSAPPPPPEEPPVDPPVTPPVLEPHVTPEPATWVLLGTGLVAILGFAALKSTRI